jgi:hypothetical protein
VGKALWSICKSQFSIEHGDRSNILQYIKKIKDAISGENESCRKKVTSYFTKETITNESKYIAVEEELFAFHTIKHSYSFRCMDCTTSVIRRLHEEKCSCIRTKCESIVVNVLAPSVMKHILEEMECVKCIIFIVDASNHKNLKLAPVLFRYFTPQKRVQTKATECNNLKLETADLLTIYIMNVLHKCKLSDKVIAFCGENCDISFGGAVRRGTDNVFAKLKTSNLKMNLQDVGCSGHILHNALQTSTDILPIDVEAIVNKIFKYFHLHTLWVVELRESCEFVDVEYKQILASVQTRWLSLLPAITRVTYTISGIEVIFPFPRKMPDNAEKSV